MARAMDSVGDARLLDHIYEAAFDSGQWVTVMEQLARTLSGQAACMTRLDVFTGEGSGHAALVPDDTMPNYLAHWGTNNPLHEIGDPLDYIRTWQPATIRYEDWVDRPSLHRSDFFNDFLRPIGSENGIMMGLALMGTSTVTMNIARPLNRDVFDDAEIALARHWQGHLARAVRLGQSVQISRTALDTVDRLVATTPHCLFFLDARGRIRRMSTAAEALLAAGSVLQMTNGLLASRASDDDARLRRLIAQAAGREGAISAGAMALRTPSGAYDVQVAPIGARNVASWSPEPIVLVTVTPSVTVSTLPLELRVRERFGLTPAEARVALALMDGGTLREIAERVSVSVNTVRAQLSAIFSKTGCRRQADLVRLLMSLG